MASHPSRLLVGLGVVVALGIAAVVIGLMADASSSAGHSTLTVVGTSDVSDSNLVAAVLKPGFEAAYPGITLNYVPLGSGPAITTAEQGAASVLLVHAASLENQFVAGGYSQERYGRAIFYGDYVLLGPAADPAHVLEGGKPSHDVVTALERIATAGAAGRANFVSRGGTPGTTVEEHRLWQLSHGVTTCTVSAANGGGRSPSVANGACPRSIAAPSWYHATGLSQAQNIENADVCSYPHGNCYTLTDRGTFDYLAATHAIHQLQIVTRDNAATAPGGDTVLVNSFHAYAIRPARFAHSPNVHLNLAGAEDFLRWVTSPDAQAAIGRFESGSGDPPFLPDAAPHLTAKTVRGEGAPTGSSRPATVTGQVTNVVPGTPPLDGVPVSLVATRAGQSTVIARGTTSPSGGFSLHGNPPAGATLSVHTPQLARVEVAGLHPPFGDLLMPTSVAVSP